MVTVTSYVLTRHRITPDRLKKELLSKATQMKMPKTTARLNLSEGNSEMLLNMH